MSEILASAKRGSVNQIKDLNDCSDRLANKCEELKQTLYWDLNKEFVDYESLHEPSLDLLAQVEDRMCEMTELKEKVENAKAQLHLSTQEFSTLKTQLDITKEILTILDTLSAFHGHLKQTRQHVKGQRFKLAAQSLIQTEQLVQVASGDEDEVKVLSSIKTEITVLREEIIYEAKKQWRFLVAFSQSPTETGLKILADGGEQSAKLVDVLDALALYGQLDNHLRQFSDQIVNLLLKPVFVSKKADKTAVLTVVDSLEADGKSSVFLRHEAKSSPTVFDRLSEVRTLLEVLDRTVFNLTSTVASCGGASVGVMIRKHLTPSLLDDVLGALDKTLPQSNMKQESPNYVTPESYSVFVAEFVDALRKISLVDSEDEARVEAYVSNLPKLCAAKQCQDALVCARELMTSNLCDTVEVEGGAVPAFDAGATTEASQTIVNEADATTPSEIESSVLDAIDANRLQPILSSPFKMPKCRVSKSIFDVMELAIQTYQAACSSQRESTGVQLVFTVRKMFELFLDVIPTYHAKILQDLPLAAALHHNNAMFLAHHITTFGVLFRNRLPDTLKNTKGGTAAASFIDLVHPLRKMAASHFLCMMNNLRTQLLETLKGAKGFFYDPENPSTKDADRTIRQIHHQLNQLAKTWRGVLPTTVYVKAMGLLLNFVVNDITSSILLLEDIAADFAFQLHQLLGGMIEKMPSLLQPEHQDHSAGEAPVTPVENLFKLVPKWQRFTELHLLLNANLTEISDRWADGKGQLAAVFSSFEVKNIIRALFENNEKRAKILKQIDSY